MAPLAYHKIPTLTHCLSFLGEHADLSPATQDSLTPQAFVVADADADVGGLEQLLDLHQRAGRSAHDPLAPFPCHTATLHQPRRGKDCVVCGGGSGCPVGAHTKCDTMF